MKLTLAIAVCVWIPIVWGETPKLLDKRVFKDCNDVRESVQYLESGLYLVHINGSSPFPVECRFELNATYTAILVQKKGQISFNRTYFDYVNGFRTATAEDYWMGLALIKHLADSGNNVLTVTLQDWYHNIDVIQYTRFKLGDAQDRYRLYIGGYRSSRVLPDDFSFNNMCQFATYDYPDYNNCAGQMGAGWWYNYCTYTLPTGHYYIGGPYTPKGSMYDGIFYKDWRNYGYSLKFIKMELSVYL